MTINVPASGIFTINVTAPTGVGAPVFTSGLTIDALGRETISGVQIDLTKEPFASQNTGGEITGITLGTRTVGSDHFTVSGTTLSTSATTADATYTWTGCTATNAAGTSDPFTLTITTLASQRTWSDPTVLATEFAAWAERGKTATLLGGYWVSDPASPGQKIIFNPAALAVAFDGSNHIVIKPYTGATVTADSWEMGDATDNLGTMKVQDIEFIGRAAITNTLVFRIVADDCIIQDCTIRGEDTITGFTDTESPPIRELLAVSGDRSKAINCTVQDGKFGVQTGAEDVTLEDLVIKRIPVDAFFGGRARGLRVTNLKILEKLILARRTVIAAVGTGAQTTITLEAGHPFATDVTESGQIHFIDITGGDGFQNRPVHLHWVSGDTYRITTTADVDFDTSAATVNSVAGAYLYGSPVGEDFLHGDYGQLQSVMTEDDQHDGLLVEGWFGGRD